MYSRLIQRCKVSKKKLRYDHMGSVEFEVGDQSKSLQRIFDIGHTTDELVVHFKENRVTVYIVAINGFPFLDYQEYLQKLADDSVSLQEPTYFDDALAQKLGLGGDDVLVTDTNAWFDFVNDVLWTLYEKDRVQLLDRFSDIQKTWVEQERWESSPKVIEFKDELEQVRATLKKNGKGWYSLNTLREIDGNIRVWLNPFKQHKYHAGWFSINQLKDWVNDKGDIVIN